MSQQVRCAISCSSVRRPAAGRMRRASLSLVAALVCASITGTRSFAQDEEEVPKIKHEDIVLRAKKDGWPIHITYYQSNTGKETPVVVLLHREGGNRQLWGGRNGLATRLWDKENYAVIAVDLRKHGESVRVAAANTGEITPFDRRRMVLFDMEAVKQFIFKEHQLKHLNMNKTAIIAPEMSAAVAVNFTANDWAKLPYDDSPDPRFKTPRGQDVKVLILLSPEEAPAGIPTAKALAALRNPEWDVSFLFCYAANDPLDKGDTQTMIKRVSRGRARNAAESNRVFLSKFPGKYRGTDLIGSNNPRTHCEEAILGFLKDHLNGRPWQDRRSRLER